MAEEYATPDQVGASRGKPSLKQRAAERRHYLQRIASLVAVRASATLRADKRRSFLGYLWWGLEPAIWLGAFWFAFASGLKGRGSGGDFIAFLMCGLVPWKWFATSFLGGGNSIFGSKGLMLQVNLPKVVLPLSIIAANTFKFLIILGLFLVFLLLYERSVGWTWFYVPLMLVCQGLFVCGTTIMLAALVPVLPDIQSILQNGIMLLFLMSGIFFDIETIGGVPGLIFHLDPMADVITAWRDILVYGTSPDWGWLSYVVAIGLVSLVIGLRLIKRYEQRYAKMVS